MRDLFSLLRIMSVAYHVLVEVVSNGGACELLVSYICMSQLTQLLGSDIRGGEVDVSGNGDFKN